MICFFLSVTWGVFLESMQVALYARVSTASLYIGEYYFNVRDSKANRQRPPEEWVKTQIPAIIDAATFERVRTLREARAPGNGTSPLDSMPRMVAFSSRMTSSPGVGVTMASSREMPQGSLVSMRTSCWPILRIISITIRILNNVWDRSFTCTDSNATPMLATAMKVGECATGEDADSHRHDRENQRG